VVGEIGAGAVILLGVGRADTPESARALAQKVANLRAFIGETVRGTSGIAINGATEKSPPERTEKANRSLLEIGAAALVVSQFTLYGDAVKGRRPSFIAAARPEVSIPLYDRFVSLIRDRGLHTETGEFGATMEVESINDGPVTIVIDL